ncbi:hypothetical protein BJ165DRAFT_1475068 [Panaeolus papilionaceus]|nr:hypothetical protein BJ165DRAFT_1475068 [Panaeolus papilionaceus]
MTELSESLLPVYGTLSATTFVLYDHLTTYDLEVAIVWKRKRWSYVQYLFMVNRYVGDTFMVYLTVTVLRRHNSHGKEGTWQGIVPGMLAMMLLGSMQCIMALRVSSLYDHRRAIVIILSSALIFEVVSMTVIFAVKNSIEGFQNVRYVCTTFYAGTTRSWAWLTFVPFTAFETLVLILVGREAYKYNKGLPRGHLRSANADLIRVIFRDSIMFPIIAIIVCVCCFLAYTTLNEKPLGEFLAHLGTGVICILGPRLILNLRDAYYSSFDQEMQQGNSSERRPSRSSLRRGIVSPDLEDSHSFPSQ